MTVKRSKHSAKSHPLHYFYGKVSNNWTLSFPLGLQVLLTNWGHHHIFNRNSFEADAYNMHNVLHMVHTISHIYYKLQCKTYSKGLSCMENQNVYYIFLCFSVLDRHFGPF
jgi:hypothetical protein